MNFYDLIESDRKEYFKILESDFPEFLNDYINSKEMQRLRFVGNCCGINYSKLFEGSKFYSVLEHSVGVALIIWHFTHSKIQTLAGLFHDISTPVFKHSIDFMNGDYANQESTEDLTVKVLNNSTEIMNLLKRDKILLEDICDYHKYPIADNNTPRLAADRLEYTFSNALFTYGLANIDEVKEIYNDIEIQKNEENIDELGFKTKKFARNLVKISSKLSVIYRCNRAHFSMQLIADIVKRLVEENKLTVNDLYTLKEEDVIKIIENSKYAEIFNKWKNAKNINISKNKPENVYSVHLKSKIRWINPLVCGVRIKDICKIAKNYIDKNFAYDMSSYVYLDFDF